MQSLQTDRTGLLVRIELKSSGDAILNSKQEEYSLIKQDIVAAEMDDAGKQRLQRRVGKLGSAVNLDGSASMFR